MGYAARISASLLDYLQERANQVVTINQLESHFKGEYTRKQIMSNMSNLLKTKAAENVEHLQTGMWRLTRSISLPKQDEKPVVTSAVFESVKQLSNGCYLLVSEDGDLYHAKPVKF